MPFDSLGSRPGFRYVPDPLGRLGQGRFVDEGTLPDPFGRVLPRPAPEPEITGFLDPDRIRDSVGMEGLNARRDVAKVESLLGRTGALDLSPTDGVTGFFGLRADEAIRKFQRRRGLFEDGLITPQGPTLRALVAEAGNRTRDGAHLGPAPPDPDETGPRAVPLPAPAGPETRAPGMPTPVPRRDAIRRGVERLLEMRKAGIDPRARLLAERLAAEKTGGDGDGGKDTPGGGDEDSGGKKPPSGLKQKPGDGGDDGPDAPEPTKTAPAPEDGGKDPDAHIRDKMRDIIDALKDKADPQAGDIDTAGPGEEIPDGQETPLPPKQETPEKPGGKKPPTFEPEGGDPDKERTRRALINILDSVLGLLLFRGAAPGRLPRGPSLQFIKPPGDDGA